MDALYFAKISWLYVRTIGVCGYGYIYRYIWIYGRKFHIHGKPDKEAAKCCFVMRTGTTKLGSAEFARPENDRPQTNE